MWGVSQNWIKPLAHNFFSNSDRILGSLTSVGKRGLNQRLKIKIAFLEKKQRFTSIKKAKKYTITNLLINYSQTRRLGFSDVDDGVFFCGDL